MQPNMSAVLKDLKNFTKGLTSNIRDVSAVADNESNESRPVTKSIPDMQEEVLYNSVTEKTTPSSDHDHNSVDQAKAYDRDEEMMRLQTTEKLNSRTQLPSQPQATLVKSYHGDEESMRLQHPSPHQHSKINETTEKSHHRISLPSQPQATPVKSYHKDEAMRKSYSSPQQHIAMNETTEKSYHRTPLPSQPQAFESPHQSTRRNAGEHLSKAKPSFTPKRIPNDDEKPSSFTPGPSVESSNEEYRTPQTLIPPSNAPDQGLRMGERLRRHRRAMQRNMSATPNNNVPVTKATSPRQATSSQIPNTQKNSSGEHRPESRSSSQSRHEPTKTSSQPRPEPTKSSSHSRSSLILQRRQRNTTNHRNRIQTDKKPERSDKEDEFEHMKGRVDWPVSSNVSRTQAFEFQLDVD